MRSPASTHHGHAWLGTCWSPVALSLLACLLLPLPAAAEPPVAQSRWFLLDDLPPEVFVDLLAYASDADGDPLTCLVTTAPTHGQTTPVASSIPGVDTNCRVRYIPNNPGAPNEDQFEYRVCDPSGQCATAGVYFTALLLDLRSPTLKAVARGEDVIEVSFLDVNDGDSSYTLEGGPAGTPPIFLQQFTPAPGIVRLVYSHQGLTPGTTYSYTLHTCSVEHPNQCASPATASATTQAPAPTPNLAMDDTLHLYYGRQAFITYEQLLANDATVPLSVVSVGGLAASGQVPVQCPPGNDPPPVVDWFPELNGISVWSSAASSPAQGCTFTYTVDSGGATDSATVTLSFSSPGSVKAFDDAFTTPMGQALQIHFADLLANDTGDPGNPDGPGVLRSAFSQPSNGGKIRLCCFADYTSDSFWYVPPQDGTIGEDTFHYTISAFENPEAGTPVYYDTAKVTVTITAPAPAPTNSSWDQTFATAYGAASEVIAVPFRDLLQNDPGEDPLVVDPCTIDVSGGTLDFPLYDCVNNPPAFGQPDDFLLFTASPNPAYHGGSAAYTVVWGPNATWQSLLTIQRFATPNCAEINTCTDFQAISDHHPDPVNGARFSIASGETLELRWKEDIVGPNDILPTPLCAEEGAGECLQAVEVVDFLAVGSPLHGQIKKPYGAVGQVLQYVAPTNFVGADVFDYTLKAPDLRRSVAEVVIQVTDGAPAAVDDAVTTCDAQPVVIAVLDNDSEPQQQSMRVTAVSPPGSGAATFDVTTNEVVYFPDVGFQGTDTFAYTVEDDLGNQAQAQVTVTVGSPPSATAVALCESFACRLSVEDYVGQTPVTYSWFLGETSLGSGPSLEVQFSEVGPYSFQLAMADPMGCTGSAAAPTVFLPDRNREAPVAKFGVQRISETVCRFDASVSTDDVSIANVHFLTPLGNDIRLLGPILDYPCFTAIQRIEAVVCDWAFQCTSRVKWIDFDSLQ